MIKGPNISNVYLFSEFMFSMRNYFSRVSYVHVPYILYVEHKLSIVNVRTFTNANFKSVSVNILLLTQRGISLCISMILKKHKFFTHDDDGDSKIT